LKVRAQAQVRVRQPLAAAYLVCLQAAEALQEQSALMQSELNVKEVRFAPDSSAFFRRMVKVDWKAANAHLRREAARFRAAFEALDSGERAALGAQLGSGGEVSVPGFDAPLPANLFRMEQEADPRYGVAEEAGILVALDLQLTEPLKREGLVRDLVRNLQVARKDAGLSVSQRIELGLLTESREIQEAICEYREYIMDELLATTLEHGELHPFQARADVSLDGQSVLATMRW
jgi:isoleucyl-tRNA synthetase